MRRRWRARRRGQGLSEYGLILTIVSVAAVVALFIIGAAVLVSYQTSGSQVDQAIEGNLTPGP